MNRYFIKKKQGAPLQRNKKLYTFAADMKSFNAYFYYFWFTRQYAG